MRLYEEDNKLVGYLLFFILFGIPWIYIFYTSWQSPTHRPSSQLPEDCSPIFDNYGHFTDCY